jgi:hypothetical protein
MKIHEFPNGRITVQSTPFGLKIEGKRNNVDVWDETKQEWNVRTTFCEDQHEFDFEWKRTVEWLEGVDREQ